MKGDANISEFHLVIITGMSGSGKSHVVRAMEDLGYFCVDNLPPALIPKFAELCGQSAGSVLKIALVVDIRGREFFDTLLSTLDDLDESGYLYEVLFLEASDAVLVKRYKETRRRHPMAAGDRVSEGIARERARLAKIRERANNIIDTSELSTNELKTKIFSLFAAERAHGVMNVNLTSFGFKYGLPIDADLVFDVRFLPNPFYVKALRRHSGLEKNVSDYIAQLPATNQFLEKLLPLLDFLLPQYVNEGKSQIVIAVGCTGGLHRSVFIAEKLYHYLNSQGYKTNVEHRDIKRNMLSV